MFGFIKNLISGIMKFITGLLPGKKKNGGYYLELKEEAETKPSASPEPKPETASKPKSEPASKPKPEAASKATSNGKKAAKPVAAAKETSNGAKAPEKAPAQPAKVELVQTAEGVTVQPKDDKEVAAANKAVKAQPTETTFAPKYLASPTSTNGRRRPGANMNSFLEMARQVKTPNTK